MNWLTTLELGNCSCRSTVWANYGDGVTVNRLGYDCHSNQHLPAQRYEAKSPAFLCWIFLHRLDEVSRKSMELNPKLSSCIQIPKEAGVNGLTAFSRMDMGKRKDLKVGGVRKNNHSVHVVCDLCHLKAKCRKCRCIPREPETDWVSLAKAVDGLFFWIFLTSSIACLLGMFATIPQPHS